MRTEIRIAGRGGQGVVLAGAIIGESLVVEGYNVAQTRSYGSAARGGVCKVDIAVEAGEALYGVDIANLSYLISLSDEAFQKFSRDESVTGETVVVSDSLVSWQSGGVDPDTVVVLPATEKAESLGSHLYTNMVLLGMFCGLTNLFSLEVLKEVVKRRVSKFLDQNLQAIDEGFSWAQGKELRKASPPIVA